VHVCSREALLKGKVHLDHLVIITSDQMLLVLKKNLFFNLTSYLNEEVSRTELVFPVCSLSLSVNYDLYASHAAPFQEHANV
jgi:hypothetical protein